jgi:hypothetical protein
VATGSLLGMRVMKDGKFVLHHTKQRKGQAIYIYYMIAWYFRKSGKPFREIIKYLGRLDAYEVDFYQNSVACLNRESHVLPCNITRVFVRKSNEYLSCAVGLHFWDHWKLATVFKEESAKKDSSTADIAKILTVLRLVKPTSKTFTTKLYPETCLPQLVGVTASVYNKA